MKEPQCFQCQQAMKYLGESYRSIKVRVNKGEQPRKEKRWYNIWYCENSHPKREHYTKGRPQRFTIQVYGPIWRYRSYKSYWYSYAQCSSLIQAIRWAQELKRFGYRQSIRIRDNWHKTFVTCKGNL